jgi:hypothetical protein
VIYGFTISRLLGTILIIILVGVSIIPFVIGIYKIGYLVALIVGTDLPLIYIAARIIAPPSQADYRFLSGFMKVLMPLGIIAIFLGSRGF